MASQAPASGAALRAGEIHSVASTSGGAAARPAEFMVFSGPGTTGTSGRVASVGMENQASGTGASRRAGERGVRRTPARGADCPRRCVGFVRGPSFWTRGSEFGVWGSGVKPIQSFTGCDDISYDDRREARCPSSESVTVASGYDTGNLKSRIWKSGYGPAGASAQVFVIVWNASAIGVLF